MQERLQYSFEALDDAEKRIGSYEPDNRFAPLAETLLWIDLINTAFYKVDGHVYVSQREVDDAGKTIEGLRYARNRLTHNPMIYGMHGMQYEEGDFDPRDFDHGDFRVGAPMWRWRIVDDLPPWDRDKTIESVYREHLEGKEVEAALNGAANFLRRYRTGWTEPVSYR
ncbi:MAG TPA: hypothetical protein VJA46_02900 [Acidimicrobiia bacterium]|nr:hypothetical protein [Acidimicrobiia bacterium]